MPAGKSIEPAFTEFEQPDEGNVKRQVWLDATSFSHTLKECFDIFVFLKEFLPVPRGFGIVMGAKIIQMCCKTVCKLHPFFQAEFVQLYRIGIQSLNKPLLLVGPFTRQYYFLAAVSHIYSGYNSLPSSL